MILYNRGRWQMSDESWKAGDKPPFEKSKTENEPQERAAYKDQDGPKANTRFNPFLGRNTDLQRDNFKERTEEDTRIEKSHADAEKEASDRNFRHKIDESKKFAKLREQAFTDTDNNFQTKYNQAKPQKLYPKRKRDF